MKKTAALFVLLLVSAARGSILRARIVREVRRGLEESREDPEEASPKSAKSGEVGEAKTLDDVSSGNRSQTSDSSLDVSSAEFSTTQEEDQNLKDVVKRMEDGNEDLLSLESNLGEEETEETSEEYLKRVQAEEAKNKEESSSENLLTAEKVQNLQKDSVLDPERVKIDFDKDQDRLNHTTSVNVMESQDKVAEADPFHKKSKTPEENTTDKEAENIQAKASQEVNADLKAEQKQPISIKQQQLGGQPGIKVTAVPDESILNDDTKGIQPSIIDSYDLIGDPDIKEQRKEKPELEGMMTALKKEQKQHEQKKITNNYESQAEMLGREGLKNEVPKEEHSQYKFTNMEATDPKTKDDEAKVSKVDAQVDDQPESAEGSRAQVSGQDAQVDDQPENVETAETDKETQADDKGNAQVEGTGTAAEGQESVQQREAAGRLASLVTLVCAGIVAVGF